MTSTSPRLVKWENGTDLVIELPLALDVATVWSELIDSESARSWFAPFTVDEAAAGTSDGDEGDSTSAITFDLGETKLQGEILSCEAEDHVLVELEDFGVLGVALLALELTDGDATLLLFTQSAPDTESARLKAADFGPMWDTHLRLFARVLGLEVAEVGEAELLEIYADLELDDSDAGADLTDDSEDDREGGEGEASNI